MIPGGMVTFQAEDHAMRKEIPWALVALWCNACNLGEPLQLAPAQPGLVILQGKVTVPAGTSNTSVKLYTADGAAIAAGTIIPEGETYNICIAPGSLEASPSLYQVSLKAGSQVLYSAPVRLRRSLNWGSQDINATTTALWLAAAEYRLQGKDPLQWDFARLQEEPTVKEIAGKLESEVAEWSKNHENSPLSAELKGQIVNIVSVASKL